MKKLSYLILSYLILTLTSCSKQDEIEQTKPIAQNTTQLLAQLQSLNDSLTTHKIVSRSCGLRFLAIAGGDIWGAYKGMRAGGAFGALLGPQGAAIGATACAIICGVGGSYLAYETLPKPTFHDPSLYRDILRNPELLYKVQYGIELSEKLPYLPRPGRPRDGVEPLSRSFRPQGDDGRPTPELSMPIDFASCIKVGTMHNKVLAELFDGNLIDEINSYDEELVNNVEYNIISSGEFKEEYQSILDEIKTVYSDTEESQLIENIMNLDDSNIGNKILKVFLDVYLNYPSKLEDVDYLINRYIAIIESTEVMTAKEKEAIYNAFAVAAYSPRFWINRID